MYVYIKPATLPKATLLHRLHRCFSRFLNGTNGTKSRSASHKSLQINLLGILYQFFKHIALYTYIDYIILHHILYY